MEVWSLLTACTFLTGAVLAHSRTGGDGDTETAPVRHETTRSGPIALTWNFESGNGSAQVTLNPDGSYRFSGHHKERRANKDFDIAFAMKDSNSKMILFRYVGDASGSVQWTHQGRSALLKANFGGFAKSHDWSAEYHFSDAKEGKRMEYEARERQKTELHREAGEARKKHDAQLASEKEDELKINRREEIADIHRACRQQTGGSGFWSTVVHVVKNITQKVTEAAPEALHGAADVADILEYLGEDAGDAALAA